MKHLIRKQVIHLELEAGQNAFSIQQQASDYYYQQVFPALEKIFDELSSENEIIHIDKFEIDLGDLGWKNGRFTLDKDSVYRILKQTFASSISSAANRFELHSPVSYKTPEENACLQWLYYLENGILPWEIQTAEIKWLERVIHQLAIDHVLMEKTKQLILDNRWFLARLIREHSEEFLQQLAEVITAKSQPDLTRKVNAWFRESKENSIPSSYTKKETWEDVFRQFAAGKAEPVFQELAITENKIIPEPSARADKLSIEEGIFCPYAGLVLLHPFFRQLFNRLQLLKDEKFKDTISLEKAITLLYFVATGKTDAKDYELVIPKIICGMPLQEVISEKSFLLSEEESGEAMSMMQAAIAQWEIIRDSSLEALRESFLNREGIIVVKENTIECRIESRSIDLLLDRLPWNISLIRFPWLSKIIHVEWR